MKTEDLSFNLTPDSDYTVKFEKDNYFPKSIDIPAGKIVPNKTNLDLKIDLIMDYAGFKVKPIYFDYAESIITDELKTGLGESFDNLRRQSLSQQF